MTRSICAAACVATLGISGCRQADPNAPPTIAYGESVCAECGMIISDDRFGVATIITGGRGDEALLFDDFNCQFDHEREGFDLPVVRRWARDHGTRAWIDAEAARFVFSPSLRTPMGSHLAAFETDEDAQAFARQHDGRVLRLTDARTLGAVP